MPGDTEGRRVALLAPMPSELRPLVKRGELRREGAFHRGRVDNVDVVASTTGIGTRAAAAAANRILDAGDVDLLIVVGIAGGVGDAVAIGEVIIPEVVIDGPTGSRFQPAPLSDGPAPKGALETSDEFIVDAERLARLGDRGVIAVDMETSAIAEVCERRGCAWSVVRAISDRAGDTPVDAAVLGLAKPDGSPNVPAALRYVLTHPSRIPALMTLARDATRAANAAAATALRALR
jgi:adenosylhomocysteine nucleosidase